MPVRYRWGGVKEVEYREGPKGAVCSGNTNLRTECRWFISHEFWLMITWGDSVDSDKKGQRTELPRISLGDTSLGNQPRRWGRHSQGGTRRKWGPEGGREKSLKRKVGWAIPSDCRILLVTQTKADLGEGLGMRTQMCLRQNGRRERTSRGSGSEGLTTLLLGAHLVSSRARILTRWELPYTFYTAYSKGRSPEQDTYQLCHLEKLII